MSPSPARYQPLPTTIDGVSIMLPVPDTPKRRIRLMFTYIMATIFGTWWYYMTGQERQEIIAVETDTTGRKRRAVAGAITPTPNSSPTPLAPSSQSPSPAPRPSPKHSRAPSSGSTELPGCFPESEISLTKVETAQPAQTITPPDSRPGSSQEAEHSVSNAGSSPESKLEDSRDVTITTNESEVDQSPRPFPRFSTQWLKMPERAYEPVLERRRNQPQTNAASKQARSYGGLTSRDAAVRRNAEKDQQVDALINKTRNRGFLAQFRQEKREREAKAAEEAARQKAAEEEAQKAAEEEAVRQAEVEEHIRKVEEAEEAASQDAFGAEAAWQAIEEQAARQKAIEKEAARQKAVEKAARQKAAEEEAARQKEVEAATRQKAAEEAEQARPKVLYDDDGWEIEDESDLHKLIFIRPLDPEWEIRVNSAMAEKNRNKVICKDPEGIELSRHAFGTLLPQPGTEDATSGWLNDDIINSFITTIKDSKNEQVGYVKGPKNVPAIAAFSSQWYTTVQKNGIQSIKRWSRKQQISGEKLLKCQRIFFPINSGSHWTLLIISPKGPEGRTIEFLDSLREKGHKPARFFTRAREWLQMELGDKYVAEQWKELDSVSQEQENSDDCGVFTCMNALAAAKWPQATYEDVKAKSMKDARKMMAAVLLNGGLKGDYML